jgi:Leucine-rich repeat (LRR) protein
MTLTKKYEEKLALMIKNLDDFFDLALGIWQNMENLGFTVPSYITEAISDRIPDVVTLPYTDFKSAMKVECKNIRSLTVHCELMRSKYFTSNILECTKLHTLNIHNARTVKDWSFLKSLTTLKYLTLWNCRLDCIPEGVEKLINLVDLAIGFSKLVMTNEDMDKLNKLKELRRLTLMHNAIGRLNFQNVHLPKLNMLDVSNNYINQIYNLANLPSLASIQLHNNGLEYIPLMPKAVSSINIQDNPLRAISEKMIADGIQIYAGTSHYKNGYRKKQLRINNTCIYY